MRIILVVSCRGCDNGTCGFGSGKQGWELFQGSASSGFDRFERVGDEARAVWGWPYSRSLAGVGGRLEGVSDT